MKFYQAGVPVPKKSYRTSKGRRYDPQHSEKMKLKWSFAAQFREQGFLKPLEGPIEAFVEIYCSVPKSWSKKRREEALSEFAYVETRPDADNYLKFYFDVLNKIAYKDDSQIASVSSDKRYNNKPGVEITLFPLENNNMINEHAITYKDKLTLEDLSYLIKKAHRLGLNSRQLLRVFQEEDEQGIHVYFTVEELKEKGNSK